MRFLTDYHAIKYHQDERSEHPHYAEQHINLQQFAWHFFPAPLHYVDHQPPEQEEVAWYQRISVKIVMRIYFEVNPSSCHSQQQGQHSCLYQIIAFCLAHVVIRFFNVTVTLSVDADRYVVVIHFHKSSHYIQILYRSVCRHIRKFPACQRGHDGRMLRQDCKGTQYARQGDLLHLTLEEFLFR